MLFGSIFHFHVRQEKLDSRVSLQDGQNNFIMSSFLRNDKNSDFFYIMKIKWHVYSSLCFVPPRLS